MRVVLKDGTVHFTEPRSVIVFTKESGHSSRVTFQKKGWHTHTTVRAKEIDRIDHSRGRKLMKYSE